MKDKCPYCESTNIEIDSSYPIQDMNPPVFTYKCNDCKKIF